jgi:uncharacterized protein (DUF924 family)
MTRREPEPSWVRDVLRFWFDDLGRSSWFVKDASIDTQIRTRFLPLIDQLAAAPVDEALASADQALANVIVLDQFSRNVFRDTPRAFATDAQALAVARGAIDRGLDRELPPERRVFLYLPFEHSEQLADQHRCVDLISALGDDEYTRYAHAHRDVIARFGRFPHRNAILSRASTPEEEAFLQQPGSRF